MADLIQIGFEIKAKGLQEALVSTKGLLTEVSKLDGQKPTGTTKAVEDTGKAALRASKDLAVLNKQVEYLKDGLSKATSLKLAKLDIAGVDKGTINNIRQASIEVDRLGKAMGQVRVSARQGLDIRAAFGLPAGIAALTAVVGGILTMADSYQLLQSRMKFYVKEGESVAVINEKLLTIANTSRASLSDVTNLFSKLNPALQRVGGTTEETLAVTEAFSKALYVGGANIREASAATIQFAQAMGSGKLAGDEQNRHITE